MNIEQKIKRIYKKEGYSPREIVQSLGIMCAKEIVLMGKTDSGFLIKSEGLKILFTVKVKEKE